jgi:hypothetical protein
MTTMTAARFAAATPVVRRWSSIAVPLAIFAATRAVDAVMIALAGRDQPALDPTATHLAAQPGADPGYWQLLTNWEGQWYRSIAEHGYPDSLPRDADGKVLQNEFAFFPLYPALVRGVMALSPLSFPVAASLLSLLTGAAAMVVLFGTLERAGSRFAAVMAVAAICSYPASPVFQAAYTESLALFLIVVCLALLTTRRYGWLLLPAVGLALTRPIALALALVIAVHWLARWRRRDVDPFDRRDQWRCAAVMVATAATFGLWPLAAALRTGTWNAFLLTQQAWLPSGHGSAWASWIGALADPETVGVGIFALLVLALVMASVLQSRARLWPLEWRAWAPAYLIFILAVAPPASSGIRYLMLTVVPWWPVPPLRSDRLPTPFRAALFAAVILGGAVLQWWWIRGFLVISPHSVAYA